MQIEKEIFTNYSTDKKLLVKYGFIQKGNIFVYKKNLEEDNMEIRLEYLENDMSEKTNCNPSPNSPFANHVNRIAKTSDKSKTAIVPASQTKTTTEDDKKRKASSKNNNKTARDNSAGSTKSANSSPNTGISADMSAEKSGFYGKITDIIEGGEYTLFRMEDSFGYSSLIRQKYIDLLIDIREKCCINLHFKGEQTRHINEFIQNAFNVQPEFLWEKFPSFAAYRENKTKKWFALIGNARFTMLNKNSEIADIVEVINVKIPPEKISDYLSAKGIFPAYHMNKKSWVSIVLNNSLDNKEIERLVTESYLLITPIGT